MPALWSHYTSTNRPPPLSLTHEGTPIRCDLLPRRQLLPLLQPQLLLFQKSLALLNLYPLLFHQLQSLLQLVALLGQRLLAFAQALLFLRNGFVPRLLPDGGAGHGSFPLQQLLLLFQSRSLTRDQFLLVLQLLAIPVQQSNLVFLAITVAVGLLLEVAQTIPILGAITRHCAALW